MTNAFKVKLVFFKQITYQLIVNLAQQIASTLKSLKFSFLGWLD
jgi:hypothetical protein